MEYIEGWVDIVMMLVISLGTYWALLQGLTNSTSVLGVGRIAAVCDSSVKPAHVFQYSVGVFSLILNLTFMF